MQKCVQRNTVLFDFICNFWPGIWVLMDLVCTSFIKINTKGQAFQILGADVAMPHAPSFPALLKRGRKWPTPGPEGGLHPET